MVGIHSTVGKRAKRMPDTSVKTTINQLTGTRHSHISFYNGKWALRSMLAGPKMLFHHYPTFMTPFKHDKFTRFQDLWNRTP